MKNIPIDPDIVRNKIKESGLEKVGKGSIREIVKLVSDIERVTGTNYIRMEMGIPGLPCSSIGLNAEIKSLQEGVPSIYPSMEGLPDLKNETAKFLKLFANADFSPMGCIPSVGSMQGSMAAIMVATRCLQGKNKTLFIDPGFPVQKLQCRVLGQGSYSFDIYNNRGLKLKEKLEFYLQNGDVGCILYSNPNNPTWVCLTEKELEIIAELANKYNVLIIEDLAYFGMDFRSDIQTPGKPPYQPTIRWFTENCILLFSGSKVFSYAGQRIGMIAMPDSLFLKRFMYLEPFFGTDEFGHAIIYGALYALSAGTAHSAQYALAAMLKAANEGEFKFIDDIKEYKYRAQIMKQVFIENGFSIVYDKDEEKPLGDGFYFTVSFPGLTGAQLMEELLYYGISSVALDITGSTKEGLRACVSQFKPDQKEILRDRLMKFKINHS